GVLHAVAFLLAGAGLGLHLGVGIGNGLDVTAADVLDHLAADIAAADNTAAENSAAENSAADNRRGGSYRPGNGPDQGGHAAVLGGVAHRDGGSRPPEPGAGPLGPVAIHVEGVTDGQRLVDS